MIKMLPMKTPFSFQKYIWDRLVIGTEKAMAPHSSTPAWKIPWMEKPEGCSPWGHWVAHDWTTSLSLFTFHFHALEEEMATHSSVLAWRIPGTGEPGGLLSMGVTQSQTRLKRLSSSSSSNWKQTNFETSKFIFICISLQVWNINTLWKVVNRISPNILLP